MNKINLAVVDERHKCCDEQAKRVPLGNISCNPDVAGVRMVNFCEKYSRHPEINQSGKKFGRKNFQLLQDKENINQNKYEKIIQDVGEPYKKYICQNKDKELLDNNKLKSILPQELSVSKNTIKGTDPQKKNVKSKDLLWCTIYTKDIFDYLQNIEENFQPKQDYMNMQQEINLDMRSILVDWLVEVGEEYKLHTETLFLAVSYMDRFLSLMTVPKDKLQLVGISSMFLAAKYEEIYPPEVTEFVYITDNTYDKQQILRMEFLLLKVLKFDLSNPTVYYFLKLFCSISCASQAVKDLSQCICELSLLDGDPFLKFSPSVIAAGSLALANYALSYGIWSNDLVEFSGYKLSELMNVVLHLRDKYISMSTCPQQATMEKYKSSKYGCCSSVLLSGDFICPID